MKFADENKNGNLSLREFKKLVELAEDMDRSKKKQESKKWRIKLAILNFKMHQKLNKNDNIFWEMQQCCKKMWSKINISIKSKQNELTVWAWS